MATVTEALARGARHQQAGQFADAERFYREALAVEPDHIEALHRLGTVALQTGRFEMAVELIGKAVRQDRGQAAYHANLGESFRHLRRYDEAAASFERAIKLHPELTEAHVMFGAMRAAQGRFEEAEASYRQALRLKPDDSSARSQLGQVLHQLGKLAEAEACFRRIARENPRSPEAHNDLGCMLHAQQNFAEAGTCYRTALSLNPNDAAAHNNLGLVLKDQGSFIEAQAHFEAALRAVPNYAAAHTNLGILFEAQGRPDDALRSYQAAQAVDPQALAALYGIGSIFLRRGQLEEARAAYVRLRQLDPNSAHAANCLGNVLQSQDDLPGAIDCFRTAVRLDPRSAEPQNNLGVALYEQGRRDEAIACYRRSIELEPKYGVAQNNLAIALQNLGLLDEAIQHFRQAAACGPIDPRPHTNLLYALNFHAGYDAQAIFAEHRAWAQKFADPLTAQSRPHNNDRTSDRRLRIGYVSPNFRQQAVNYFVEPILASHDHARFEITCYPDTLREDETTARLRGYADHWRPIYGRPDPEVSELIRRDQIDILVDLSGHMGDHRMFVFARKPAPVQVTYIGYQNTTGMLAMDYRLTDAYADPEGLTDEYYTERLVRLPRTFFCYQPAAFAPPVGAAPSAANGYVTFGSFNNFSKVSPTTLDAWARILSGSPGSRLVLLCDTTPSMIERVAEIFAAHGVERQRVELAPRRDPEEYLKLIASVDIALDPFPFNGHTTTCDALWQGVPVVTLSGQTYASRFGGSGLATLGLRELIAATPDQYVEIATTLGRDAQRLDQLRKTLRDRFRDSPLCDFQQFTRDLEAAYRGMWTAWCAQPGRA